jgi:hypothetical protein
MLPAQCTEHKVLTATVCCCVFCALACILHVCVWFALHVTRSFKVYVCTAAEKQYALEVRRF